MSLSSSILVEETDSSLRLWWDNRTVQRDRFLGCMVLLFWCFWCPVTLFVSLLALFARELLQAFFCVWLIGGWAGTIGIPYYYFRYRGPQSVTVDLTSITLQHSERKPRVIPLGQIAEITVGYYPSSDSVPTLTLYIICTKEVPLWRRRVMVGYWISADLKRKAFDAIELFVTKHNLGVRMRRLNEK